MHVSLREVRADDLPFFFEHQRDPEAARLAAFPSREHEAFTAHWRKVLADAKNACRTILADGAVAGNIGAWTDADDRLVSYWIGREFWGRGVATAALREFLLIEPARPLTARVARHNLGSLRVLQKCGFAVLGDHSCPAPKGDAVAEWVLSLPPPAG
ncbi:MAG TPA: GNAT family N-acetyltransferase [Opitutaceae bacterium]|nr:GNAT family N-acetyltransferase [Opitutaceae bacterium]